MRREAMDRGHDDRRSGRDSLQTSLRAVAGERGYPVHPGNVRYLEKLQKLASIVRPIILKTNRVPCRKTTLQYAVADAVVAGRHEYRRFSGLPIISSRIADIYRTAHISSASDGEHQSASSRHVARNHKLVVIAMLRRRIDTQNLVCRQIGGKTTDTHKHQTNE